MRLILLLALLATIAGTEVQAQQIILPCVPSGSSCIPVSAANPLPTTGNTVTSVTIGTTTLTSGTDTRVLFQDGASPTGVLQEDAGLTFNKTTGLFTSTLLTTTAGTLGNGVSAFTLTATQPTTPVATQNAVSWSITGAGSAAQTNNAFQLFYNAGYTGASTNAVININNANLGTGNTLVPATNAVIGNVGVRATVNGAGTGLNAGLYGWGGNSTGINVGVIALAQTTTNNATNIGLVASGNNPGAGATQIGAWISLNRTTVPATSAAMIVDIGAQSAPVALFQVAGATVASINVTGGFTATLTNVATTSAVCYAPGTNGLLSYDATVGTCTVSALRFKNLLDVAPLNLAGLDDLRIDRPWVYKEDSPYASDKRIHVGLIADDIREMDSRCVVYDNDGELQNYDDRCVLLYLVADRKALKARIVALEEKVH